MSTVMSRRRWGAVWLTVSLLPATASPVLAQSIPPLPPTTMYVLPVYDALVGLPDAQFAEAVRDMRLRLGEGPLVKVGFSVFTKIEMDDWDVDTTNPEAIRANLKQTIRSIDRHVQLGVATKTPVALLFQTAIRDRYDPVQSASELEDRRNMQWYDADNGLASGWWTFSPYARKQRRVAEAYIREVGKVLAGYMARYPDIVVAGTGDGEVELSYDGGTDLPDYSPFAVAEFRDWLRQGGMYAPGQSMAGQGYANSARYAGDASPAVDTNGDGHTLNGDFGVAFSSWDLRYFNWSLGDDPESDPNAISALAYNARDWNPQPDTCATCFDPPRTRLPGDLWWKTWVQFKQEMVWRYNRDFARWMTTSPDPVTGARVPAERWYSAQVPTDYLFGSTPDSHWWRHETAASPWWTADVSPYGGLGITAYNLRLDDGRYLLTLDGVAPLIAARGVRWGIVEWGACGLNSTDAALCRIDMDLVEKYRPHLLIPFMWRNDGRDDGWYVDGTPFETTLRELIARIKDPSPSRPVTVIDSPVSEQRVRQPFRINGWALDKGTVIGPGWGTGVDAVHVYAYPDPGSNKAPMFLGAAAYGTPQPAAAAHGTQFTNSGFTLAVPHLPPGRYDLVAFGRSTVSESFNVSKTVTVDVFSSINPSPASLKFGATKAGAADALVAQTPPQSVTLAYDGPGTPAWTATADQAWVHLTNASGSGPGQFTVSIVNPGNVLGGHTSLTATITITSTAADISSSTVEVALTIDQSGGATAPPFGMVDAPVQYATGVVGSIGVTGWALDDVGISAVTLYRQCLPFEPPSNCAMVDRYNLVYMGVADMVPGARPDVEAAYPGYPQASRAGWGYLLLTNMLPHIPTGRMFGGQGPVSIYVFATDVEGHQRLLGRSTVDQTPTTITLANDTTGKPFGAIDTPGQGETVSGTVTNFGWALTPDRDTAAGAGDIVIPTDGSTMWVWVDGVPAPVWAYNLCRGTVGSPVLAGLYCNDDVANIFGNPTPQAVFMPRSGNATKYRNLDAGRGAMGAYFLDTRALSNGRHSIVWGVTDSAGRVDGIGSRDFIVLNTGASRWSPGSSDPGARAAERLSDAPAEPRGDAGVLGGLAPARGVVQGRTGFDLGASSEILAPDDTGVRHVRFAPLDRLELWLGAVDGGFLVANGTLRDLPPGSRLDPASGLFTWTPGVAYFGTYGLAFVRDGEQIAVDVTIRPVEAETPGEAAIRMHVEAPSNGAVVSGPVTVAGWALDPQASIGSGIATVHVWAQRRDQPGAWPEFLGTATLGGVRPDVAAAFGPSFGTAGFSLTSDRLEPGQYDITAYVWNRRTARWEDARTVAVVVR